MQITYTHLIKYKDYQEIEEIYGFLNLFYEIMHKFIKT